MNELIDAFYVLPGWGQVIVLIVAMVIALKFVAITVIFVLGLVAALILTLLVLSLFSNGPRDYLDPRIATLISDKK